MQKLFFLLSFLCCFTFSFAQNEASSFLTEIEDYRNGYKEKFQNKENSPLQEGDFEYLRFYEANENYRLIASFEAAQGEKPFEMATYAGTTTPYIKYGIIQFELAGEKHQLALYQNLNYRRIPGLKELVFLPMKDLTNGEATYGGGRYLYMKMEDIQDNKVIIDFNKLFNPYCAYSDGYKCPIPPTENHLEIAVEAGELMFAKAKDH